MCFPRLAASVSGGHTTTPHSAGHTAAAACRQWVSTRAACYGHSWRPVGLGHREALARTLRPTWGRMSWVSSTTEAFLRECLVPQRTGSCHQGLGAVSEVPDGVCGRRSLVGLMGNGVTAVALMDIYGDLLCAAGDINTGQGMKSLPGSHELHLVTRGHISISCRRDGSGAECRPGSLLVRP